jgi:hypothetical protein
LLQVCRRVLGIGGAADASDDGARRRADAGTAAATDCAAERGPEAGPEKSAAERLGIGLVAQWRDLRVGILPARLIIIIGLRHRRGVRRNRRQNRPDQPCRE